jgi:hypothetical protein
MELSGWVSNVIAFLAFIASGYAIWTTRNFNNRQLALIESQEKLNQRHLKIGETEDVEAQKADVSASLVTLGTRIHRLKIFNRGKATARNVRIVFPDGYELVPQSEITEKLPLETLEQHSSVDLLAYVHSQTPRKQRIILHWADDYKETNEKPIDLVVS